MKKSHRQQSGNVQILYGVNPLIEALRANRLPNQITIAEGARDERLRELIELARRHDVPISYAPRINLDREAGNTQHQGVIARLTPPEYADADELLESIEARVGKQPEPLAGFGRHRRSAQPWRYLAHGGMRRGRGRFHS